MTRTQGLEAGGDVELQTDADPAEEGEGPGGQQGGHPAGAAGESTQGHGRVLEFQSRFRRREDTEDRGNPVNATKRITENFFS